jgi:hypothetical protein
VSRSSSSCSSASRTSSTPMPSTSGVTFLNAASRPEVGERSPPRPQEGEGGNSCHCRQRRWSRSWRISG